MVGNNLKYSKRLVYLFIKSLSVWAGGSGAGSGPESGHCPGEALTGGAWHSGPRPELLRPPGPRHGALGPSHNYQTIL